MVQEGVDPHRPRRRRAQYVRALLQRRFAAVVLEMATDGRHDLDSAKQHRADRASGFIWIWLANRAGRDLPDQPFRSIRVAAGVALSSWPQIYPARVPYAR